MFKSPLTSSIDEAPNKCPLECPENGFHGIHLLTQQQEKDSSAKNVKLRTILLLGALLPGIGCYFCAAWAYVFQLNTVRDFAMNTCARWLPPVSYIGHWEPQKYMWMFVVTIHFPAKLLLIVLYRRLFLDDSRQSYQRLAKCYLVTLWMEPIGLISVSILDLTLVEWHALASALWVISFNLNMLFNVILHRFSQTRFKNKIHEITWCIKSLLLLTGFALSFFMTVAWVLAMNSCNTFVYYAFSITEYLLIGCNSAFYSVVYWEFSEVKVSIGLKQLHDGKDVVETVHEMKNFREI
ncbi:unnamed protein product, partial [Mesorhabditis belari]|uniref:CWH43-like N-terminal domain-containing protein n=1 Tax=Mesorhabditis belari TaxID=2138241 RepID=A0AAF3JAR7_9BILA